jgi:hypothetical protein
MAAAARKSSFCAATCPADAELVNGQAVKRQRGEVLRLPAKEAKKLVNAGAAKFTETD